MMQNLLSITIPVYRLYSVKVIYLQQEYKINLTKTDMKKTLAFISAILLICACEDTNKTNELQPEEVVNPDLRARIKLKTTAEGIIVPSAPFISENEFYASLPIGGKLIKLHRVDKDGYLSETECEYPIYFSILEDNKARLFRQENANESSRYHVESSFFYDESLNCLRLSDGLDEIKEIYLIKNDGLSITFATPQGTIEDDVLLHYTFTPMPYPDYEMLNHLYPLK